MSSILIFHWAIEMDDSHYLPARSTVKILHETAYRKKKKMSFVFPTF